MFDDTLWTFYSDILNLLECEVIGSDKTKN